MLRVFVSGPMTSGHSYEQNIRMAIDAGVALLRYNIAPFIPHLFTQVEIVYPQSYERWLEVDLAFLLACHALYRIPGESTGADKEVAFARDNNIPVFTHFNELIEWAREQAKVRGLAADIPGLESSEV